MSYPLPSDVYLLESDFDVTGTIYANKRYENNEIPDTK